MNLINKLFININFNYIMIVTIDTNEIIHKYMI